VVALRRNRQRFNDYHSQNPSSALLPGRPKSCCWTSHPLH
jgi:hypothetical protein